VSPGIYRAMLNAGASALHSVHGDNKVIGGALAPVGDDKPNGSVRPMQFMRDMLCMTGGRKPKPTCSDKSELDGFSVHPYTFGGPAQLPISPDNVSLASLPKVRSLLQAAYRSGRVIGRKPPELWVTEFSWDSRPPDPNGVPSRMLARWVSEALFRAYSARVSVFTWFQLRDAPKGSAYHETFQSGLYSRCEAGIACDRPKLSLRSFQFPLVAYVSGKKVYVWLRTPSGKPGRVTIEQRVNGKWKRLASRRTDGFGVISKRVRRFGKGPLRARISGGARTLTFSLRPEPYPTAEPFG
jgi:hypothetical protein